MRRWEDGVSHGNKFTQELAAFTNKAAWMFKIYYSLQFCLYGPQIVTRRQDRENWMMDPGSLTTGNLMSGRRSDRKSPSRASQNANVLSAAWEK